MYAVALSVNMEVDERRKVGQLSFKDWVSNRAADKSNWAICLQTTNDVEYKLVKGIHGYHNQVQHFCIEHPDGIFHHVMEVDSY